MRGRWARMYTKSCIICDMSDGYIFKPAVFLGVSLEDLRTFPLSARKEAGHQIDQVQRGFNPDDWKPMNAVGYGQRRCVSLA